MVDTEEENSVVQQLDYAKVLHAKTLRRNVTLLDQHSQEDKEFVAIGLERMVIQDKTDAAHSKEAAKLTERTKSAKQEN